MVSPAYPAFNIYSHAAKYMTPLGPVVVATAVNDIHGWDVEVIDENNYHRGPRNDEGKPDHGELQSARPADVVGLYGGLTSTIPRLLEIAREYQAMGVRTIAGGQHFADENIEDALRNGIDIIVIGEGEKTIAELLDCLETGGDLSTVKGLAYLAGDTVVRTPDRELLTDFEQLPIPDYSLLRYAKVLYYPISGIRGCGMHCEFCTVKAKPRFASPERMMEQIASIYEKRNGRVFFIVDDLFGQNRLETLRFCQMLGDFQRRIGKRFSVTVQIRLDRAKDTELIKAMRYASVNTLAIGIESPIAEELEAMNKHLKPEDMIDLARTYHRAGFRVHGMFIFGYPAKEGHPFHMSAEDRVKHFRRFIRKAKLDTVQVLLPIPLPGTELTARLAAANRIYSTDCIGLEYYDGNFPIIEPDEPLTAESMQKAIRKIMGRFYRFNRLGSLGLHVLSLPAIGFYFHKIKSGWRRWYRTWMRKVYRAGGWVILRRWDAAFKKGGYPGKLSDAKRRLTATPTDGQYVSTPARKAAAPSAAARSR